MALQKSLSQQETNLSQYWLAPNDVHQSLSSMWAGLRRNSRESCNQDSGWLSWVQGRNIIWESILDLTLLSSYEDKWRGGGLTQPMITFLFFSSDISSVSPAAGSLGGGTDLTITGDFFDTPMKVTAAGKNDKIKFHGISLRKWKHDKNRTQLFGMCNEFDGRMWMLWDFSFLWSSFFSTGTPCQIKHISPQKISCTTGALDNNRTFSEIKPGIFNLWPIQMIKWEMRWGSDLRFRLLWTDL